MGVRTSSTTVAGFGRGTVSRAVSVLTACGRRIFRITRAQSDRTIGLDTVVSHKSTDLRRASYRSASRVYYVGMRFVGALATYTGEVRCDHKKKATYYLHWAIEGHGPRILEWFIPEVGVTPDRETALTRVVTDAASAGVTVRLLRVRD